jgi:thioredoxin-dependent peroxiredoxin
MIRRYSLNKTSFSQSINYSMPLTIGDTAPNFTLPSTSGKNFTLHTDFRGKIGIIYFYPKDFSPGCTAEACSFRDAFEMFREVDVPVVGISPDDIPTHTRFREAHKLPFHLLADSDKQTAEAYGVLAPIVRFVNRVTFLVDQNMKIVAVFQSLFNAHAHIEEMVAQLKKNQPIRV